MPAPSPQAIAAVRRFNRFYTRQIGVLRKGYLDSPYSLGEMRVLYEIAQGTTTARDIGRNLDLDAGYLSRVLRNFEKAGLIARKTSAEDARQSHLSLTAKGSKTFAPFEARSQQQTGEMLAALSAAQQTRLVAAMAEIEALTASADENEAPVAPAFTLRAPHFGDFGWIVARHGVLYAEEYGWGEPFEGLCAQIVADYVNKYDAGCERCWIAEANGENVGCVMLVKDDEPGVARIRLLLVDPKGRGLGVGRALVKACVAFARESGYRKITLWTHSVLIGARHIYETMGFTLTSSEKRHSWGKDVVAEFWDLDL